MTNTTKDSWEWEIGSHERWWRWDLSEIWQYKDLLLRLVRRDLLANYRQTVLGPLWVLVQPVLTTLVYFVIFGRIVKVPTDGIPPLLFYMPGVIIWAFFSDCLTGTMYTFLNNSAIFSKVYFPRLLVPLANIIVQSVRLIIQLILFFVVCLFFITRHKVPLPGSNVLLLPLLLLLTAGFSLGAGLIISVVTAKYRDLDYAIQFILRLFMFAAPVVFPAAIVPERYRTLFWLNPLTPVIETFRSIFLNHHPISYVYLFISTGMILVIVVAGIAVFKKRERTVMDII